MFTCKFLLAALCSVIILASSASGARAQVDLEEGTFFSIRCDTRAQVENILKVFQKDGIAAGRSKYKEYHYIANPSGYATCTGDNQLRISKVRFYKRVGKVWEVELMPGELYRVIIVKMKLRSGYSVFGTLSKFIKEKPKEYEM